MKAFIVLFLVLVVAGFSFVLVNFRFNDRRLLCGRDSDSSPSRAVVICDVAIIDFIVSTSVYDILSIVNIVFYFCYIVNKLERNEKYDVNKLRNSA
jgi:Ca2+/Na+ antiporter